MAIVRWDPFKDLVAIQDRINKIFDETASHDKYVNRGEWEPLVDVYELEKEIALVIELPGVKEDDIDIQISEGVLSVKGEKKLPFDKETDNYFRLERQYGKFSRMFNLPPSLDFNNVKASMKDGLLKISVPKKEEAKPKVVKVINEG